MSCGKVYLIGAGPGDVELLTLKAVRAISNSDVILLDSLVNPDVLQFASANASVIEVGKRGGRESVAQTEIQQQMVAYASQGLTVARVKGGDPSVFGRSGEEIEALIRNNVPFEIVAGVTAASGICASLGISLTHRDCSHSVTFLAGPHFEPPCNSLNLPALAGFAGTLIVYMGLKSCAHIADALIARGLDPSTPSVAVQSGTLDQERAVWGPIQSLPKLIEIAHLNSPVLIIIGLVVALSPKYLTSHTSVGVFA